MQIFYLFFTCSIFRQIEKIILLRAVLLHRITTEFVLHPSVTLQIFLEIPDG
jgi:hypothetical protein